MIDANLFPKLMEIISCEIEEVDVKREAYYACANAFSRGSLDQIYYLIELGIVIPFCNALTSTDHRTVILVLCGLEALFTAEERMKGNLVSIVESCGVQKLELLKEHSNDEIVLAALKLLDFIKEYNIATTELKDH